MGPLRDSWFALLFVTAAVAAGRLLTGMHWAGVAWPWRIAAGSVVCGALTVWLRARLDQARAEGARR